MANMVPGNSVGPQGIAFETIGLSSPGTWGNGIELPQARSLAKQAGRRDMVRGPWFRVSDNEFLSSSPNGKRPDGKPVDAFMNMTGCVANIQLPLDHDPIGNVVSRVANIGIMDYEIAEGDVYIKALQEGLERDGKHKEAAFFRDMAGLWLITRYNPESKRHDVIRVISDAWPVNDVPLLVSQNEMGGLNMHWGIPENLLEQTRQELKQKGCTPEKLIKAIAKRDKLMAKVQREGRELTPEDIEDLSDRDKELLDLLPGGNNVVDYVDRALGIVETRGLLKKKGFFRRDEEARDQAMANKILVDAVATATVLFRVQNGWYKNIAIGATFGVLDTTAPTPFSHQVADAFGVTIGKDSQQLDGSFYFINQMGTPVANLKPGMPMETAKAEPLFVIPPSERQPYTPFTSVEEIYQDLNQPFSGRPMKVPGLARTITIPYAPGAQEVINVINARQLPGRDVRQLLDAQDAAFENHYDFRGAHITFEGLTRGDYEGGHERRARKEKIKLLSSYVGSHAILGVGGPKGWHIMRDVKPGEEIGIGHVVNKYAVAQPEVVRLEYNLSRVFGPGFLGRIKQAVLGHRQKYDPLNIRLPRKRTGKLADPEFKVMVGAGVTPNGTLWLMQHEASQVPPDSNAVPLPEPNVTVVDSISNKPAKLLRPVL